MQKSDALEAVGGAYYVLHLLPVDPGEAAAGLAAIEHALAHPNARRDGWAGPTTYVFLASRKRDPNTAAAVIDATRVIIQAGRS